ncbi:hypothetical protein INT43_004013 [Umbelopsis isabellina]|uniref:glucan 1,3-beta-glucosidase n=1 Tax=Mortierella isabellina TaxID=91625 RepID=A0A8H7PTE5_MORIS|nr:hypothetical protein INT43_004013 [Umbelopsis isabellina]
MSFLRLFILLYALSASSAFVVKRDGTAWNFWTQKAFGANLGNWLILERWLDPGFFGKFAPNAQDEWTFCQQAANATELLQQHWQDWITEDDFRMLASVNANHVRIPVGYWAFIPVIDGEPYIGTGQKAQIERILGYCAQYNINAIIDLHALPGSQNGQDHSGRIGPTDFFQRRNVIRSLQTVEAVVAWMNGLPPRLKSTISAIEVINEPHTRNVAVFNILKDYYQQAYKIIDASAYKVPMIFSDSFRWLSDFQDLFPYNANALIDTHYYWMEESKRDVSIILKEVCDKKQVVASFYLPVLVGEWSIATQINMDEHTTRQFLDTQLSVWKQSSGGLMWSLKNAINSKQWSFEQLVKEGYINSKTFSDHTNAIC